MRGTSEVQKPLNLFKTCLSLFYAALQRLWEVLFKSFYRPVILIFPLPILGWRNVFVLWFFLFFYFVWRDTWEVLAHGLIWAHSLSLCLSCQWQPVAVWLFFFFFRYLDEWKLSSVCLCVCLYVCLCVCLCLCAFLFSKKQLLFTLMLTHKPII